MDPTIFGEEGDKHVQYVAREEVVAVFTRGVFLAVFFWMANLTGVEATRRTPFSGRKWLASDPCGAISRVDGK